MLLVEVDPVCFQASQAILDGPHDVATRCTLQSIGVVHRHGKLCGENDVLAPLTKDLSEAGFRSASLAIDVGGVEQRDAEIDGAMDDLARRFEIDAAAEVIAAEANAADAQAGPAEIADLHHIPLKTPGSC